MKYLSMSFCLLFFYSCDTIKKDEPEIKKIIEDAVGEELDDAIKAVP